MPDQDPATLRDTTVSDPPEVKESAKQEPEKDPAAIVEPPSEEATEMARVLMASGVTRDQMNALLEAPRALEALRYQMREDPKEFVRMLERTEPGTGDKFLAEVSDLFLERNKHLIQQPADDGKGGKDGKTPEGQLPPELLRELQALREQTSRLVAKDQQREAAVANATIKQRYDARVDDLLGLDAVKGLQLSTSQTKNLRARLFNEMNSDPEAVRRANSGNFVDVPTKLQPLLKEIIDERKGATEKDRQARERVDAGSFFDFPNGPDAAFLGDIQKEIAADTSPDWDGTVNAFAKALERGGR